MLYKLQTLIETVNVDSTKSNKAERITIKKIAINTANIRNVPVPVAARSKA